MTLPQRQVLIAGGAGFIGSHLVDRLLEAGDTVVVLDNFLTGRAENLSHLRGHERLEVVEGDVIDPIGPAILARQFSHVVNAACAASPQRYQADPEHTLLTNVVGTRNLLRLAERDGAQLLLTSTSEIYGEPEVHPQPEDYRGSVNCTGPRACYDEGKRAAEALCFDYDRAGRVEVRVVRIFNTYGPRMDPEDGRVVSNLLCQAIRGEPITVYGDGQQTRSYCFVADLVEGLVRLMDHKGPQPGPINLGNPEELSVAELVGRVLALSGSRSAVTYLPLPQDDPRRRRPDISRARDVLGWAPTTALDEGLGKTHAHFAAELEAIFEAANEAGSDPDRPLLAAAE